MPKWWFWFSLIILLTQPTTSLSADFRSGSLSYLYGEQFKVEPNEQQTITFEYVTKWHWGDFFLFVDFKDYHAGGSGRYGEFSPRIKLIDFDADSLLRKISLSTTFERGKNKVEANLYGVAFDLNIKRLHFLNLNFYQRDNPNQPGKGYQMTTTFAFASRAGHVPLLVDGYFDWTFNSDEHQDNFHFNPQIKIDMQQWLGGTQRWFVGVEYDYWRNKYGIKNSPSLASNQNTFSLLAKWHF